MGLHPRGFVPRSTYVDGRLVALNPAVFEQACEAFKWSSPNNKMEQQEVQKYAEYEEFLADPFVFEEAIDLVLEHLEPYVDGQWRSLDQLELEMSGSPGRPYKYCYASRAEFLEDNRPLVEQWLSGNDASDVWDCFGKLEILPKEKANLKCRLICGAGMRCAVVGACLHEHFNKKMSASWMRIHSKVGFSKFHRGWDALFQSMDCAEFDEADCKQWDSGMHARLLHAVYDIRARLGVYTAQQWRLFDSFLDNLVNSTLVLSDGSEFLTNSGNKSGSPCTANDNTLGNLVCLAYAWLSAGGDPRLFHSAPIAIYGDDLITGSFGSLFWDRYRDCGVKLPLDRLRLSIPYHEVSFLSQRTKIVGNTYVPVPRGLKYVYAAVLSDSKISLDLQYDRLWSLWVEGYWCEWEPVLREFVDCYADLLLARRASKREAERIWLSLEGVGNKLNHDAFKEACQSPG